MTNKTANTAGLPLFQHSNGLHALDVQAILDEARVVRARAIVGFFKAIGSALASSYRAIRTARTLDQLSDHMLADIGIERSQIPSISKALANGTYIAAIPANITVIGQNHAAPDNRLQQELPLAA
ncbi:MAG: DUF1127 domain-containing protein [Rhodospirillales bacterium]